jgi:hypothetical protein
MAISAIIDALDKLYCAITTQTFRPLPEEWTRAWIFSSIGELLGTVATTKLRFNGVQLFRYLTSEVGVEGPGAPARAAVEAVRQPPRGAPGRLKIGRGPPRGFETGTRLKPSAKENTQ